MGLRRRSLGAEWRRCGGELRKREWWWAKTEEGQSGLKKWKRMWWEGDGKWCGKLQTPLMKQKSEVGLACVRIRERGDLAIWESFFYEEEMGGRG